MGLTTNFAWQNLLGWPFQHLHHHLSVALRKLSTSLLHHISQGATEYRQQLVILRWDGLWFLQLLVELLELPCTSGAFEVAINMKPTRFLNLLQ